MRQDQRTTTGEFTGKLRPSQVNYFFSLYPGTDVPRAHSWRLLLLFSLKKVTEVEDGENKVLPNTPAPPPAHKLPSLFSSGREADNDDDDYTGVLLDTAGDYCHQLPLASQQKNRR